MKKTLILLACVAFFGIVRVGHAHPLDRVLVYEKAGLIDEETAWKYKIYAVFDQAKLPIELQDEKPSRCGTWIRDEFRRHFNAMSAENQALLVSYSPRFGRRTASVSTDDFPDLTLTRDVVVGDEQYRIHYTFTGADATTQNFVDDLAAAIQTSVTSQKNTYGYTMPRYEDGETFYHIFLSTTQAGSGTYAFVQAGGTLGDNTKSTGVTEVDSLPSYMVFQSRFTDFLSQGVTETDVIKGTFSHEHFHSIQYGYTSFNTAAPDGNTGLSNLSSWLAESTATWMETAVYPDLPLNYGEYLGAIFSTPQANHFLVDGDPNNATGFRQYASFLSHQYIMEHASPAGTGKDVVKNTYLAGTTTQGQTGRNVAEIWKAEVEASSFNDFNTFLKDYTIGTILRTAAIPGGNGKYIFEKAASMHNAKGGAEQGFTYAGNGTFAGTTVNFNSNALKPGGANFFALQVNQPATITMNNTSTTSEMSIVAIKLSGNEDLADQASRTSVQAVISNETTVATSSTQSFNLGTGKYVLRVVNLRFEPTSTTNAPFNIAVTANATPVTISCDLTGDTVATHAHVGDVALVAAIVAGTSNSTVCANGACDFNKDNATAPTQADVEALANISVNGDANTVCGSTFGE